MTRTRYLAAAAMLLAICVGCSSEPSSNSKTHPKAGESVLEQEVPAAPGDQQEQVDQKQSPADLPSKSAPGKSVAPPAPGDTPTTKETNQEANAGPLQELDKSVRDIHRWTQFASLC